MSDDRKKQVLEGLGDLDWDSALDEWEKTSFEPAVAAEAEVKAAPADQPDIDPPNPALPTRQPPTENAARPGGTLITRAPGELRGPSVAEPRGGLGDLADAITTSSSEHDTSLRASVPPSMRGGLDQLFSRPRGTPSAKPFVPTTVSADDAPPEQTRIGPISVTQPFTRAVDPPLDDEDDGDEIIIADDLVDDVSGDEGRSDRDGGIDDRADVEDEEDDDAEVEVPVSDSLRPHMERESERTLVRPSPRVELAKPSLSPGLKPIIEEDEEDKETFVRDKRPSKRPSLSDAETQTRLPADDDEPTIGRPSGRPSGVPSAGPPPQNRLDVSKTEAFERRIAWLEEEARAAEDPLARGRGLLAVSELAALMGESDRAYAFALEARDAAPSLALAWRQARHLMPAAPEALAEILDAEAASSPTPSARAHATLMAADVLRIQGNGDAAVMRWDSACKLDPADVRAPIARAAVALAQNDHTNGALKLADNSELVAFDKAIGTALRMRGVERAGSEFEENPINDGLRHARNALREGDVVSAAQSIGEIATMPELATGALWLSSSFGAAHIASRRAAARAAKTLAGDGDALARRALAARGLELEDPELVAHALSLDAGRDTFTPAERATLAVLSGKGTDALPEVDLEDRTLAPLEEAIAALQPTRDEDTSRRRAARVSGERAEGAMTTLGRWLAASPESPAALEALEAIGFTRSPSATGVAIEASVRAKRWGELSEALSSLPSSDDPGSETQRHIAAAIVAERADHRERAQEAWSAAARSSAGSDGLLRIAADVDRGIDLGAELLRIANDMPDGVPAAILRLEAIARSNLPDEAQAPILERVHRAAPALGIAGFLAEQIGRRRGDLDEVLRWIQERRTYATDPLETALDAVREALLVADRDRELASTRLEEAHRARPHDVALRELHERLAVEPPADRAAWRESRAAAATGPDAAILWVDAALEHDRVGDAPAFLAAARRAASAGDRGLSIPMIERGEWENGETATQTEALMELTKTETDERLRREAFERLAAIDAYARKDLAAANMWHRAILEGTPHHKPSLRWLEHAFIRDGRDDELAAIFEQIAVALSGAEGGEATAHAQHAARLRVREAAEGGRGSSAWERTQEMAILAATQPEPSLWGVRASNAHARFQKDDVLFLDTALALLDRTQRPQERAALLLRASEAAARLERTDEARAFLERAATEDPGDVVTWGFVAELRERAGESHLAAEACESLARTSVVPEHQLLAWHDAAKIWFDEVKDTERAMSALEAAAEIDPSYADVFPRLSALYADRGLDAELTQLLEKRLGTIEDAEERVALEVELARAFAEMGELAKAKGALESALDKRPSHTTALSAMAEICVKQGDWAGAEHAYVRLARLLSDPAEQRAMYERLGEIYAIHAPNLARAEVAYREVLKRSPGDLDILGKLVDVFRRQGDVQKAAAAKQEIVTALSDPDARLAALVELAAIYEVVGRDPRRSEQVLDSARKEFPTSVVALRAMAEFYARQKQMPAMQILLDRAAGDARRAFAQGRFVPSLFQVLHAAFELRGKADAARVVAATLAAVEGHASDLAGAEARAVDHRLDDLLAPDLMSPALRALLFRTGDALDIVAPVDLRTLKAAPLPPGTAMAATVGSVATYVGLGALQILVSSQLGRVALPLSSNPPTLLVGEGLTKVTNERARLFVVVRAMKMILMHASAMIRCTPQDVPILVGGIFNALNPSYVPHGVDAKRVQDYARRIGPALPRNLDPTVGVIALEAAGTLGTQWPMLAPAATAWANRVALLAVGDPNAALEAIAWDKGEARAPTGSEERAAWIARHAEARELMTFSVTDTYAEARARLGLDK